MYKVYTMASFMLQQLRNAAYYERLQHRVSSILLQLPEITAIISSMLTIFMMVTRGVSRQLLLVVQEVYVLSIQGL